MPIAPLLASISDAASALGIGATKTKELINSGELRSVTIDRRRLVPVEALNEYVQSLEARQVPVEALNEYVQSLEARQVPS